MGVPDNVERHKQLCEELNALYERKNHDYGDSFHISYLEEGMAMARIRLSDKLNRFKTLSKSGDDQKVSDESMRDTLVGLANYALMTVMEIDRQAEEVKERISKIPIDLPKDRLGLGMSFEQAVREYGSNGSGV